jgi:SAM-dependent methyltransferase
MVSDDWSEKADYLFDTRPIFFNDDYLRFYFVQVLGLRDPVRVVDFGCGVGYLGVKLLRIMGGGVTYTGVDLSEELLAKARRVLGDRGGKVTLIQGNAETFRAEAGCDLAICQALLMHCANPRAVLRNMRDNVRDGGRVVCIEPNWNSSMAATHIAGLTSTDFADLGILQRLFESDHRATGKDGNIGIKVPLYMEELGLTDIDCRKSDKVSFITPHMDKSSKDQVIKACRANGFGRVITDEQGFVRDLVRRGLTEDEALRELSVERRLNEHFNRREGDMYCTFSPNMIISSGRVSSRREA